MPLACVEVVVERPRQLELEIFYFFLECGHKGGLSLALSFAKYRVNQHLAYFPFYAAPGCGYVGCPGDLLLDLCYAEGAFP